MSDFESSAAAAAAAGHSAGLAAMRVSYGHPPLDESQFASDPFTEFHAWLAQAHEIAEPNAMVLSTASAQGVPRSRHVLLKGLDSRGFMFFTNLGSHKAGDLAVNPVAALCFPWSQLQRQVSVVGGVEVIDRQEVAAYWQTRPRQSQLGAWASQQSSLVAGGRATLERQLAEVTARFPDVVPVPEFWGGFRVVPTSVEFWQGGPGRLHDRLEYVRSAEGSAWSLRRLSP